MGTSRELDHLHGMINLLLPVPGIETFYSVISGAKKVNKLNMKATNKKYVD